MNNSNVLLEFSPKLPKLSKSEKKVLGLLVEAAKLIAPIYLEQINRMERDLNFYPSGVKKAELEEAAKKDPSIFSPFTVVEKVEGKLMAIPYHIKYAKLLRPVASKLIQASELSDNKEFSRFLKLQARVLIEGSYEEAVAAWMKMKPYIFDISIGPAEHFDDELFYKKAAYQAWVGVMDSEGTKRLNNYRNVILNARREALIPGERLNNFQKVKAITVDVLLLSGLLAKTKFVGFVWPMNINWITKHGSEVIIFNQVNDWRMKEQIMPTFKKIFSSEFRKSYSFEDLRRASLRYVAFHEIAHNFLFYKHAEENLQDLLEIVLELTATLLGMRIAGSLLLKDMISSKQLESMIIAFICRSYDLIQKSKKDKNIINYAIYGAIFINFMLESSALKQKHGMAIPNFTRIFVSLQELSYIMERLLALGTRKDAKALVEKYGNFNKILKDF